MIKSMKTQFYEIFVIFYDDVIGTGNGQIRIQRPKLGRK